MTQYRLQGFTDPRDVSHSDTIRSPSPSQIQFILLLFGMIVYVGAEEYEAHFSNSIFFTPMNRFDVFITEIASMR